MKKIVKYTLFVIGLMAVIWGSMIYYDNTHSTVYTLISEDASIKTYTVRNGKSIKNLETPTMDDYVFMGWYRYEDDEKFDTDSAIYEDTIIYAKWAKINIES